MLNATKIKKHYERDADAPGLGTERMRTYASEWRRYAHEHPYTPTGFALEYAQLTFWPRRPRRRTILRALARRGVLTLDYRDREVPSWYDGTPTTIRELVVQAAP